MLRLCIFTVCLTVLISKIFAQGGVCNHQCVSSGTCNWKQFQDKCYYLFKDNTRTWSESKSLCQHENLDVGQFHKGFQTNDLFNGLGYGVTAWQGGEIKNLDQLEYVNGEPFTQTTAQRVKVARECGTVKKNRQNELVFGVENCNNGHHFICRFGHNFTVYRTSKTWFDARTTCVDQGGDLFYLYRGGEDVNQILKVALDSYHNRNIYMGPKNFKWQWSNSSEIRRYNWASGQPGNHDEECIAVYSNSNKWHDWSCRDKNYAVCQKGCRFELTESWGQFSSPNYPEEYPLNTTCEWLITVAQRRKVHLLFLDFRVTYYKNTCPYDSIKVYDGLTEKEPLAEYCGATIPAPLNSTGNSMRIVFKSVFYLAYSGFLINYYSTGTECPAVSQPQHGFVTYPDGWHVNAQLKYKCEPGYELQGTETRQCQADGRWTASEEPTCIPFSCGFLDRLEHGRYRYIAGAYRQYQSSIEYICDTVYHLRGDSVRVCQGNKMWSGEKPLCELIECPVVETPTNGQVIYPLQTGRNVRSTLTYKCTNGYALVGSMTRTCQADGKWTPVDYHPTCQPILCNNLLAPANGTVIYTMDYAYPEHRHLQGKTLARHKAIFTCNKGFILNGSATLTCIENKGLEGRYDHQPPFCKQITCNNLLAPANGTVYIESGHLHGKTLHGHKAIFSCNKGFILNGSATLTCTGDDDPEGRFDGQPPSCEWLVEIAARTLTQSKSEFPHTVIPWILLAISLLIIGGLVAYIIISKRQKKNDDPVEMCDNTYYDNSSGVVTFTPAAGVTGNTDRNQALTSTTGNNAADDMQIVDNEYYDSFEASGGAMAQSSGQKPAFKVGPRTGDIYSQVQKEGDEKLYANI